MAASMPSIPAACPTPWAWFPDEAATIPRLLSSPDSWRILFRAPLALKEPLSCWFSSLSQTSPPHASLRKGEGTMGVSLMRWPMRLRAA